MMQSMSLTSILSRAERAAFVLLFAGACSSTSTGAPDATVNQPDGGAVAFLDLRVEEVSATRAVVRFDTSEPVSCEAEYGLSASAMTRSATDPNMQPGELTVNHEVPLEDLTPDTTYSYRAKVVDAMDRVTLSETFQFTTLPDTGGTTGANVALLDAGASIAGVSSNYGGASNAMPYGGDSAIDGLMATEWSADGDGDDAWLEIDLGRARSLSGFGFRSRKMTDGTSIIESLRLVFADGSALGPYATPDPDQLYRFDFPSRVTSTRVRVEAITTTGGNTGVKEVELYEAP